MTHPETASRQALCGYSSFRLAPRETGSTLTSGVVAYPGLEASHLSSFGRPQPTVGQASRPHTGGNGHESVDASRDAIQPTSPSSSSLRPTLPAQGTTADIRQSYPSVYSEPQRLHWYYYDPTRYRQSSSHLQATPLSSSMSGPPLPSISTSGTALVSATDAMLDSVLAPLKALQFQFTSFQENLGNVKSDVKDALSQLHALRTAQSKTDKCIAELEDVIGISSTGTRSRGRGRRGRGRGRGGRAGTHADSPLEDEGVAAETVPEKTLVQSLASIQFAIQELLARDSRASQSLIHREAISPPPLDPAGQASFRTSSPPRSVADPSQQYSTLQSTQLASATSPTSQSESSSPLSSIAIPTPELETLPSSVATGKEYADTAIQACSPSHTFEPSCHLSYSQRHAPGLTPVAWNVDPATVGWSASNSVRPTAYTAEYLAHFLHDTHFPSGTSAVTDSQTPRGDSDHPLRSSTASYTQLPTRTMSAPSLSSYPTEPVANISGSQRARSTVLPTASSNPDSLVVPSARDTGPATETPLSATRILQSSVIQTHTPTTESMASSGLGPPGDSHTSLTFALSSLGGMDDTPISVSGASRSEEDVGYPVQPHAESDPDDVQMTSDTDGDEILVTGGVKMAPELTPTPLGRRRQFSPVEADDGGGLTSGLPTPPSETFTDDGEPWAVSRLTREHGTATDPKLISCTPLPRNFPVIPTPPCLTPEPSVGEDRGMLRGTRWGSARQGSLGVFSGSLSPLTPPLPSPFPAVDSLLSEEGGSNVSEQVTAQKVTEKHTDSTDDATEGVSTDAPMSDGRSSPQIDWAGGEGSISATNSGVPVITVTHEPLSTAMSNQNSSQTFGDVDLFMTPRSSVGQPNIELPELHPDTDGIGPACSSTDAYGWGFSSPWRHPSPPTSAIPSRYATPSDSSDSRPTQDEDEVLSALILGASGMSTPVPGSAPLPLMFSHQPSRASSVHPHDSGVDHASSTLPPELFAIDPSMLHDSTLPPRGLEVPSSLLALDGSLSPLTSLYDTDMDNTPRALHGGARHSKKPRASAPADRSRGSGYRGYRSEPYHAPSSSHGLDLPSAASVARAASEATTVGGGPSASLDELALLARREPLKIHLRLPGTIRSLKRKRGAVDGAGREKEGADSERVHPGASMPVEDASQEGQGEAVSAGVSANMPPSRTGMVTPASSASMSQRAPESSTGSGLVDRAREHADMISHPPVSGKRTKKQTERGREVHAARMASEQARLRQKKPKRAPKGKPKSSVKYHVRNGQIVTVEPERVPTPEPRTQVPMTPPASQPAIHAEEVGQDSRAPAPIRHRKGQGNQAMKTPLSSPVTKSRHPTPRGARLAKSSLTKEDVWNMISQDGGTWPELPSVFSHWDAQFIQCDNCDKWYHYGCVAIKSGDPRLDPGALFICPTCHTQSARRQTLRNQDDICTRPDCPEPQVTGETELYFVEKLVGRRKLEGYIYMWLAKWEGFPMTQATWIPKENVVGDGTKLFDAFLEDAVEEGADLSLDVVLLQEALEAGWESC